MSGLKLRNPLSSRPSSSRAAPRTQGVLKSATRAPSTAIKSSLSTFTAARNAAPLAVRPAPLAASAPPMKESNVKLAGITMTELKQSLDWMYTNGGPRGKAAVDAFVAATNAGTVEVSLAPPGVLMQGGYVSGVFGVGAKSVFRTQKFPTTPAEQLRWGSQFTHEMMHMTSDRALTGTGLGETHAYLAEYGFYKDLGYSNDQIRAALGSGAPAYMIGTMKEVYGVDTETKAFAAFAGQYLGGSQGGGTQFLPETSSSSYGNGLTSFQLAQIAHDIQDQKADIRNLTDDPGALNR